MNETIRGLIATTINRLANAGYSETIVETYQAVYNGLVRFCETDGVKAYTTEVGECFWNHFQKENPNMSRDRVSAYRTGIKHLDCVFLGSEFKKGPFGRVPLPYEDSCFNGKQTNPHGVCRADWFAFMLPTDADTADRDNR